MINNQTKVLDEILSIEDIIEIANELENSNGVIAEGTKTRKIVEDVYMKDHENKSMFYLYLMAFHCDLFYVLAKKTNELINKK